MSYGKVYCLIHMASGKKYVGQTTRGVKNRLAQHIYDPKCHYIHNALNKYGVDAFQVRVLAECGNQESLNIMEEYFIWELETLRPNGYNLNKGGDGRKHGPIGFSASLWNVPADLRAWFERRAQDHLRSLSAQIVTAMIDYKDRAEAMRHGEEE